MCDLVEQKYEDLCSAYAISFAPYQAAFVPLSLQAPFTQWTQSYSDQQTAHRNVERASQTCLLDPAEACSLEWWEMYFPSSSRSFDITVGCMRQPTFMALPCTGTGGVAILNGSIITTSALVCGAKAISQLIITTDITPTTSTAPKVEVGTEIPAAPATSPAAQTAERTATPTQAASTSATSQATEKASSEVRTPESTSLPETSSVAVSSSLTVIVAPATASSSPQQPVKPSSSVLRGTYSSVEFAISGSQTTRSATEESSESVKGATVSSQTPFAGLTQQTFSSGKPLSASAASGRPSFASGTSIFGSSFTSAGILAVSSSFSSDTSSSSLLGFFRPTSASRSSEVSDAGATNSLVLSATDNQTKTRNGGSSGSSSSSRSTGTAKPQVSNAATTTNSTIEGDPSMPFALVTNEVIIDRPFTTLTYFAAMFLPAMIAVLIKSLWGIIASSLKMIEPFQRLVEGNGVSARYSILTQYLGGMMSWDIFRALAHGRMIPICSMLIYSMVEISPLIASISINVRARKKCVYEGQYRPCDPAWVVNMPLIRLLEGLLLLCIGLVICLMWLTRKSRIPVATNPSSIASLAVLLNYEPLLVDLQRIDPDADSKLLDASLKSKLFALTEHHDSKSEQTRFGFVSSRDSHQRQNSDHSRWQLFSNRKTGERVSYAPVDELPELGPMRPTDSSGFSSRLSFETWTTMMLHLFTTSGLLTVILYYWLDSNLDSAFNRFFNGDSVPQAISKTVFVGIAIIVDMQMKNLERIIRVTDPFRRLALRNARAETTILLPLNGTCWSNLSRNLYLLCRYEVSQGRMAWVTMVSFVACLADANIIAVSGLVWTTAQTRETYLICGYLSMACTSVILLVIVVTMVWWLNVRAIRRMPRRPDTIGNILSYVCGSEMVKDWNSSFAIHMECLGQKARDTLIIQSGRRFCFGRMHGMDERERWCIDYEREQSQFMIVNQRDAPSILSVPTMPLHWQEQSQQVRRKPVSARIGQENPGWEAAREGRGYQELATERRGRFPSLRVAGDP